MSKTEPGIAFIAAQFDGIMGMGWLKASMGKIPSVFQGMCNKKIVDDCSFAFYLSDVAGSTTSELQLGGYDKIHASSEMTYHKLKGEDYWRVESNFKAGTVEFKGDAIIDSGTSLLVMPTAIATKLGWTQKENIIDCSKVDTLPTLTFNIDGSDYTLTGKEYVLNIAGTCLVGVMGMDLPATNPVKFILGDVFMRKYYVHFDYTQERIGITIAK